MKLAPIPRILMTTPVTVVVSTGQTRYGEPLASVTWTGYCRLVEKLERTLDAERRLVTLSGHIYLDEDPAPGIDIADGTVTVGSKTWVIYKGERQRNPDNTVHHVKIMMR